jgi:hypothetical protein
VIDRRYGIMQSLCRQIIDKSLAVLMLMYTALTPQYNVCFRGSHPKLRIFSHHRVHSLLLGDVVPERGNVGNKFLSRSYRCFTFYDITTFDAVIFRKFSQPSAQPPFLFQSAGYRDVLVPMNASESAVLYTHITPVLPVGVLVWLL